MENKMHDDMRLDDALGPEFSVRIMNVCARNGVETIGQLRDKLDQLPRWKGLGRRSINEITDFYRRLDAPPDKDLFSDPEYLRYLMEDGVSTVEALLHDVLRGLTRAALKGHASGEFRNHARLKLMDAAERVGRLPLRRGDNA